MNDIRYYRASIKIQSRILDLMKQYHTLDTIVIQSVGPRTLLHEYIALKVIRAGRSGCHGKSSVLS